MRTFIPPTYEVRLQVKVEIGVVVANDHSFVADTAIAMEEQETREPSQFTIKAATIQEAISNPNVPQLYANGFHLFHTDSDSAFVFLRMGQPVAVVHLSYTVLKEIATKAQKSIEDFEEALGASIPDMSELQRARDAFAKKRSTTHDHDKSRPDDSDPDASGNGVDTANNE